MKTKTFIAAAVCSLSTVPIVASACRGHHLKEYLVKREYEQKFLEAEKIKEDRDQVIKIIENYHPDIVFSDRLGVDVNIYKKLKEEYIKNTNKRMTIKDFDVETKKYLNFFKFSDTWVDLFLTDPEERKHEHPTGWQEDYVSNYYKRLKMDPSEIRGCGRLNPKYYYYGFIAEDCFFKDGNLCFYNKDFEEEEIVTEIGDVPVSEVVRLAKLELEKSGEEFENDASKERKLINYIFKNRVLKESGVVFGNIKRKMRDLNGVYSKNEECLTLTFSDGTQKNFFNNAPEKGSEYKSIYKFAKIDDKVFIGCLLDDVAVPETADKLDYYDKLEEVFEDLKRAKKKGCKKFVINLSDFSNNSYDEKALAKLLKILGIEAPKWGYVESKYEKEKVPPKSEEKIERKIVEPSLQCKKNPNVQLMVLCNNSGYDSFDEEPYKSLKFYFSIKDGNLGTLVGVPYLKSQNKLYGNYARVNLKNSNMRLNFPTKKYIKPDGNLNENILKPDIEVCHEGQALKAATDFLVKKK